MSNKAEKVKYLQKQIKTLQRELADNTQISDDLVKRNHHIKKKISKIENQLDFLVPKELHISDHAVLRYMERHQNIDVEGVRNAIREELDQFIMRNGEIRGFVIRNNTVVTYIGELPERGEDNGIGHA